MNLIDKALEFATDKHKGQKYGEHEFIIHPLGTEELIRCLKPNDYNLRIAALLHDTMEDSGVLYEELKEEFNEDVANLVFEVTKTAYNTFPSLLTQRGVILKFADRLNNLSHMEGWDEEKKAKYIEKSRFWKI